MNKFLKKNYQPPVIEFFNIDNKLIVATQVSPPFDAGAEEGRRPRQNNSRGSSMQEMMSSDMVASNPFSSSSFSSSTSFQNWD